MSELNYWKIRYEKLPSLGREYPEGSSISFRCLNVRDLKYLAAMNEDNSRDIVNEILRRCLSLDGIEFKEILEGDRMTLIFYLRTNTFQLSNKYQTDFTCPYCDKRIHSEFGSGDLIVKRITECKMHDMYLDGSLIRGVHKKISDKHYTAEDPVIEDILNWTDIDKSYGTDSSKLEKMLGDIDGMSFSKLRTIARDAKFGILGNAVLKCSSCLRDLNVGLNIGDINMFNRVKTTVLIKNQIHISKYCGIVITDDMPYNEVELLIATVNEMAKKDEENLKNTKSITARRV